MKMNMVVVGSTGAAFGCGKPMAKEDFEELAATPDWKFPAADLVEAKLAELDFLYRTKTKARFTLPLGYRIKFAFNVLMGRV